MADELGDEVRGERRRRSAINSETWSNRKEMAVEVGVRCWHVRSTRSRQRCTRSMRSPGG
eukprot:880402-Pyramimonas_sp.AAC.1